MRRYRDTYYINYTFSTLQYLVRKNIRNVYFQKKYITFFKNSKRNEAKLAFFLLSGICLSIQKAQVPIVSISWGSFPCYIPCTTQLEGG